LRVLADPSVKSVTLITSREPLGEGIGGITHYSLPSLNVAAWEDFFSRRDIVIDAPTLQEIHNAYGGNALAMNILCDPITREGGMVAYWQEYKVADGLLVELSVENLVREQFNRLEEIYPEAYRLLCRLGCYRYQTVPTVPREGLLCLLWDVPESRRKRVIESLRSRSLVECQHGEYWLHPVIREEAINRLRATEDWETANRQAADFWTKSVEIIEDVSDAFRACEAYNHLYSIKDYKASGDIICNQRKNRWVPTESLGAAFYRLGLLDSLVRIISILLNKLMDSFLLAKLYNIIGDAQWLKGNIHTAISCHKKCYENASQAIHENQLKQSDIMRSHFLAINSYFNTALCQADLLEMNEAKKSLEHAINLANDLDNQYKNISLYDLNEDVRYYLKRLSIFSKPHGHVFYAYIYESVNERDQASSILTSYDPLLPCYTSWQKGYDLLFCGQTYLKRQEFDSAMYFFNLALSYASESNYTQVKARALIGLADIYRQLNNIIKALSNSLESVTLLKSIKAKPDLAEAYFQLGLTYQAMGKYDQAETYKAKALELFEQMEAPKQIERVNQAFEQGSQQ